MLLLTSSSDETLSLSLEISSTTDSHGKDKNSSPLITSLQLKKLWSPQMIIQ